MINLTARILQLLVTSVRQLKIAMKLITEKVNDYLLVDIVFLMLTLLK